MNTRNKMLSGSAALVIIMIAVTAMAGGTDIDETRKVDKDAKIAINVMSGTLTISGWDRNEVEVTGTLDEKADGFKISGDADDMEFKVKYPQRVKNVQGSHLEFKVPRGCRLEVETVSTDIELTEFEGGVEIASVSGEIIVNCKSTSTEISGVSGDITVKGVRDNLEVSLVSGDAGIEAENLKNFSFNAVSGQLHMNADIASAGDWEISCHSGDVVLVLPGDIDADFEIDTFSGDIETEFGVKARRTSKYAPGKELIFTNGKGGASIEISIFSGEVRLEKK